MPDKNLKSFMLLADNLENLADGAKKHSSEQGYPAEITDENIRALKLELETSREQYVLAASEASKLKETYENKEDDIADKVARYKTMLYGFYGKKSKHVQDFGLKPYKERVAVKNNAAPNANA